MHSCRCLLWFSYSVTTDHFVDNSDSALFHDITGHLDDQVDVVLNFHDEINLACAIDPKFEKSKKRRQPGVQLQVVAHDFAFERRDEGAGLDLSSSYFYYCCSEGDLVPCCHLRSILTVLLHLPFLLFMSLYRQPSRHNKTVH